MIRKAIEARTGVMSADELLPGRRVFVDHFQCAARGRKFTGDGRHNHQAEPKRQLDFDNSHCGGVAFVDAATRHIGVEFQTALNQEETIKATQKCEDKAKDCGIVVKECQFDDRDAFMSKQLRERLESKQQKWRCSALGSHHQNGRAEQAIQTIMAVAGTMSFHQAAHWQQKLDTATETLRWPMGVQLATHVCNHVPGIENALTPHELWTRTEESVGKLHNLHVFGCPLCVLEKDIADGKKMPRWKN